MHGVAPYQSTRLFQHAPAVGTRAHSLKLAHSHSTLECRRRFFSIRIVGVWNSLPASVVELSNLGPFKAALKETLGDRLFDYYL